MASHARPVGRGDSIDLGLETMSVDEGITLIKAERVAPLLVYLRGGQFENNTNLSYMKAYSVVVQFGDQPQQSLKLYQFYQKVVEEYCKEGIEQFMSEIGTDFILKLAAHWEKLTILIYWLQRVFQYLDRFFTKDSAEYPVLFTAATKIYTTQVYQKARLRMVAAMIELINRERDGFLVEVDVLRRLVELLCTVEDQRPRIQKSRDGSDRLVWESEGRLCYKSDFEGSLLKATGDYYSRWVQGLLSENSCPAALHEIERKLAEEEARIGRYLDRSSATPLRQVCHKVLILETAKTLVDMDSGAKYMFYNAKAGELKCMFQLFKREPEMLKHLTAVMEPFIEERCKMIVEDATNIDDTPKFVQSVLKLKKELDELVQKSFGNEAIFQRSRNKAFENILNKDTRCARYLALYCDLELKKTKSASGSNTDEAMKEFVEEVVGLFAHLRDKDIFLDGYKKSLAKRLLKRSSISDYAEEEFLSRLKVEVGQQAIQKLQCMFTDMRLSDALQAEYAAQSHGGRPGGVVHDTRVLQVNAWPDKGGDDANIIPCPEMRACITAFESFYNVKHNGRKLRWNYLEGTCELSSLCYKKKHIFLLSPLQGIVLMLFNSHRELSFQQVLEMTKIPEEEGRRQLTSISVPPKQRLLKLAGDAKKIDGRTVMTVNADFMSEKTRVVVNLIKEKEKPQVVEAEVADATNERKHVVDAAIVRVMKARKRLQHNALLEAVVEQCKLFCPQPLQIKMQIQQLIEREFLQRAQDNHSIYEYRP